MAICLYHLSTLLSLFLGGILVFLFVFLFFVFFCPSPYSRRELKALAKGV